MKCSIELQLHLTDLRLLAFAVAGGLTVLGLLICAGCLYLCHAVNEATRFQRHKFQTERDEQERALHSIRRRHAAEDAANQNCNGRGVAACLPHL